MKLRLTRRAATELDDLLTYIEQDSPQAAQMVAGRIEGMFDLLLRMPTIGKPSVRPNVREYVVPRLPLIIVYRQQLNELVVLAVFHTSRDPNKRLDRA